jgi:hypothetical protein
VKVRCGNEFAANRGLGFWFWLRFNGFLQHNCSMQMTVRELAPGSTAADLVMESSSGGLPASRRRSSLILKRPKVNHQVVDNFHQKLRMGDLVELTIQSDETPVMVPLSNRKCELTQAQIALLSPDDKPCGKISLEFQREQLKRLYLDDGSNKRGPGPSPQEKKSSVASLS